MLGVKLFAIPSNNQVNQKSLFGKMLAVYFINLKKQKASYRIMKQTIILLIKKGITVIYVIFTHCPNTRDVRT